MTNNTIKIYCLLLSFMACLSFSSRAQVINLKQATATNPLSIPKATQPSGHENLKLNPAAKKMLDKLKQKKSTKNYPKVAFSKNKTTLALPTINALTTKRRNSQNLDITTNNQGLPIFIKAKNQASLYEDNSNKRSANDLEALAYDFLEAYKETLK